MSHTSRKFNFMGMLKSFALAAITTLMTGCAQLSMLTSKPVLTPTPVAMVRNDVSEEKVLADYSLSQLSAAEQLLKRVAIQPIDPEGEGTLGCRLNPAEAQKSLSPLAKLIAKKSQAERTSYESDPITFARKESFDNCSLRCSCGTFASMLAPVDARGFKRPSTRTTHQSNLKKLRAKASRQSAEEGRICAEKQAWYCASDLRDFVEVSKGSTLSVTAP